MRDEETRRYARHLMMPELDAEAHERLRAGRVLVVGAGGLGSSALYYMAAAGVGHLGIIDDDVVEVSNLQRQILHATPDIGRPKTQSAAEKLRALNPEIEVECYQTRFSQANALDILGGYDVIVTAVDNFPSRYLLNDAAVLRRKTLVEGGVTRFSGMAITIKGGETTCYRCLFPLPPVDGRVPCAAETGVFGPTAGIVGVIQAAEAIKVIAGIGDPLYDRLLTVDLLTMSFEEMPVERDPGCPVCGEIPSITEPRELEICSPHPRERQAGGEHRPDH
jgi:molybdopterin/thiamine biosynthesis adenylyltransferase